MQISSHRTEILDRAVTRLIGMWPTVQHKLEESFANYTPSEIHCDEENVLLIDEFVVRRRQKSKVARNDSHEIQKKTTTYHKFILILTLSFYS